MFQEKYKKANDSIPCNQELKNSLMKKAEAPSRNSLLPWICATAAVIGISVFSYMGFHQESNTDVLSSVASNTPAVSVSQTPKAETKKEKQKSEGTAGIVKQESDRVMAVAVAEQEEVKTETVIESEEPVSDIPATASVVMPKTVELEPDMDYSEEIPQPAEKTEVPENQQITGGGGAAMASVGGASMAIGASAPRGSETEDSALTEDADVETVDGETQGEESPQPTSTPMLEPALTEENAVSDSQ